MTSMFETLRPAGSQTPDEYRVLIRGANNILNIPCEV